MHTILNQYIYAAGGATLSDTTVEYIGTGNITVGWQAKSTGYVGYNVNTGTYTDEYQWLTSGSASSYEVRATKQSGDTPGGTLNSWLALSSSRTWTLGTGPGTSPVNTTCVLLIEIRNASTLVTVASATITLHAQRT